MLEGFYKGMWGVEKGLGFKALGGVEEFGGFEGLGFRG